MILWLMILVPVVFALAIAFAPEKNASRIATAGSFLGLGLGSYMLGAFDWADSAAQQFESFTVPILPELGIGFAVGADSIAVWLIALTALLQPLMVVGSYSAITEKKKAYYAWLTALQAPMIGVFAAQDLIFFYVCFELTLIPMFILISVFGSTNRKKASVKFFLYTFTGSIIALAGLVYVAIRAASGDFLGEWTFEIAALAEVARQLTIEEQSLVLLAMMLGFAVKVPLFPVHTWLPLAHTEAPTAGSVILAGVLLKLGTYAILRFVLGFVPDAVVAYAVEIAVLSIIGIVYAGLICWVQRDVKKLVAYSSVSHLGFCVLGMFALNMIGLQGSVLYMINHGLSTGALFFCIGMMYERYHTRSLDELGGLASKMPIWAFFMGFFTMASVGLPGLNGFVSEIMCLLGTFASGATGVGGTPGVLGPVFAAVAGLGMIIAAMYLLYMMGKLVFGPLKEPAGHAHHGPLPVDLSAREIGVLVPLAVLCVVLGLYPKVVSDSLEAPLQDVVDVYTPVLEGTGGAGPAASDGALDVDGVAVALREEVGA